MISFKPSDMRTARYTAVMGLLFALSAALNLIESAFSVFLPAGMRLGLSNIIIMAAILCLNLPSAMLLVLLKALFIFITRGASAGIMSFCGSLAAFIVTALLFERTKASYILISILGAVSHSLGQIIAAFAIIGSSAVFAYFPVLAAFSLCAGTVTGMALKTVFPILRKFLPKASKK